MSDLVRDLLSLADRLERHRLEQRDHVLIRRETRAGDGPIRHPEPVRRKESLRGAHSASQRASVWNWKSKGT